MQKNFNIFWSSVFFVLGFTLIFSILGVLLQGILSSISFELQKWLSRLGGVIIILFGLYILGLINIKFLEKEHKFHVKKLKSTYLTSFIFGAAFAVGWTPCVGIILGTILTLAVTNPSQSFLLLLVYSLGLGIPFILVGLFTNQAQNLIVRYNKFFSHIQYVFGFILIIIGILVFTNELARLAGFGFAADFLVRLDLNLSDIGTINIGIAFLAGLVSFLSPCILPLIPAFLTYLASTAIKENTKR